MTKFLRATAIGKAKSIRDVRWDARTLVEGRHQLQKIDRFISRIKRRHMRLGVVSATPDPTDLTHEIHMVEDVILEVLYRYRLLTD